MKKQKREQIVSLVEEAEKRLGKNHVLSFEGGSVVCSCVKTRERRNCSLEDFIATGGDTDFSRRVPTTFSNGREHPGGRYIWSTSWKKG